MKTRSSFEYESIILGTDLSLMAESHHVPPELFEHPDHLAFNTSNAKEFGRIVRGQLSPLSWEMLRTEKGGRFSVLARLKDSLPIYEVGLADWVTVDEGDKVVAEGLSISYAAFYSDSLERARSLLLKSGVEPAIIDDGVLAVSIRGNLPGTELRIVHTPFETVAQEQIESGEAVEVDLSQYRQTIAFIDGPVEGEDLAA